MFDSFEREISYLRISVTDKCNLRCRYCMPPGGVEPLSHTDLLSFEQIAQIARSAVGLGFDKIRLTGGEPLVRRGVVDLVRLLRPIPGLTTLAMTTNGTLLERFAEPLKRAGLDRLNVSIDTLNPERYSDITRGGRIEDVLAGLQAAKAAGFEGIKINMVVFDNTPPGEADEMAAWCETEGFILQRIRRYSLDTEKTDDEAYDRPPPCGDCNRLRLTCDGFLKPCLHGNREIRVDLEHIEKSITDAVMAKPSRGGACTVRPMTSIGG